MAGTEQKCIAAGMDSYLSKPYTLTELADALRPWLPSASEQSVEKQADESVHTSLLGAPKPQNDQARVRNLESYAVLDTESEEVFDRITRLASNFLNMPICLVSLIDGERQWFKSRTGLEAVQTPREQAFCGYTILGSDVFVVEDATSDERFASNPLVFSDPNIRFYAGAPLLSEAGFNLGSLCVIDTKPRTLDVEQQVLLSDLAGLVCRELEIRKAQFTDSVTGTFNRAGVFFQGSRQLAKAQHEHVPLSVAVVSLNNLKAINDFLGADAGDVALRCVADVATSVLREHDTVGRLGGGMFAFIMPGLSAAQAGGVVGDVLSEIGEQNIFPTGHDLLLSATAGVASSDVYETDFTKVYNRADGAFSAAQFENVPVVCAD